jgi:tagatose 1,6-diphosphate aldolase
MEFTFFDPGFLVDRELQLRLEQTLLDTSGEETLPTYRFRMVNLTNLVEMGFINLRVGQGENLIRYRGHIGYGVNPEYRGHGYAARACCLLLPLSRRHGLNPLWITCNPDNIASRKTCERLGAQLVEVVTVPEGTEAYRAGARQKYRYRLGL